MKRPLTALAIALTAIATLTPACAPKQESDEAILDRIQYDAYKIKIQALDPDHDRSMREVYGLSPEEAE